MNLNEKVREEIMLGLVKEIDKRITPGWVESYGPNSIGLWVFQKILLKEDGSIMHLYKKAPKDSDDYGEKFIAHISDPDYIEKAIIFLEEKYNRGK